MLAELNRNPSPAELRRFGGWLLALSAAAAAWLFFARGNRPAAAGVLAAGALLGGPALGGTRAGVPGYLFWNLLALAIGKVAQPIALGAVFFLVLTPLNGLQRLLGRDRLQLRRPRASSHWHDLPPPPDPPSYQRQF